MRISISVNGDPVVQQVDPCDTLLSLLREQLHLTGTKWGCLTGDCGACSVIVDGKSVVSCLQTVGQVDGADITTIEGIAGRGCFTPLICPAQRGFLRSPKNVLQEESGRTPNSA